MGSVNKRDYDLTKGNVAGLLLRFSVPYLISCFLQTFYGLVDLYVIGRYNGVEATSAVSVGSQVMHMLTVVIVGLAMGTTISVSRSLGEKRFQDVNRVIGNSIIYFSALALVLTTVLLVSVKGLTALLSVPESAVPGTVDYLTVCFVGLPFIIAYNFLGAVARGKGDSRTPLIFVAVAGVLNIFLDFAFVGGLSMGPRGAALATVISQAVAAILYTITIFFRQSVKLSRSDLVFRKDVMSRVIFVGVPVALQEGFIQISFLVITAIANSRGVYVAAAVGVVEKFIGFVFLVPSAMLSTVSVMAAQNAGAGIHSRARQALRYGIMICVGFGALVFVTCNLAAPQIVSLFTKDSEAIRLGAQYLKTYSVDCALAGVHFCMSGFFNAYEKSMYSFIHNLISALFVRVPGAYIAAVLFPESLYAMGIAAPLGSLLSVLICAVLYRRGRDIWGK